MKKLIVIVFIIFGAFLTFSLYRTFAYDTSVVEEVPSTTDLEYTFKIGNSSIKQITVDSGETKYYDVVLGNPNPAKISYGFYYEMVNPSSKSDGFSIEYTSKSTGESTGKVDKEGNITLNLVVTNTSSSSVTVKLGTVAGYVNGGELTLSSGQEFIPKRLTVAGYVMSLDDGTTGDSGSGVYKVHHDAILAESSATGEVIEATNDYRYYGASPDNYICLDMEGQSSCPDRGLYRIIGSIYESNSKDYSLKIRKATPLHNQAVNSYVYNYGINTWATITSNNFSNSLTSGTSIMKLLNSGDWWNNTNDYLNYGITDIAKEMVSLSVFYLGGSSSSALISDQMYTYERGINRSSANKPLFWLGKIGLMYASDYGYASGNNCAKNVNLSDYRSKCSPLNWLNNANMAQWLINSSANGDYSALNVSSIGDVTYTMYIAPEEDDQSYSYLVYPSFYINSNVVMVSGTGSETNPYQIELG